MRLTIPHHFRTPTGRALDGAASWDELRATDTVFGVPTAVEAWHQLADSDPSFLARARSVSEIADRVHARRVASYGIGSGLMERHLVGMVDQLVCGDFTPVAIERVRALLPSADVRVHDLAVDPPFASDLHVLVRVDSEFGDAELGRILDRFEQPVLLAVTEFLTGKGVLREGVTRLRGGRRVGWTRTEDAFRALTPRRFHVERVQVGELDGFLLTSSR